MHPWDMRTPRDVAPAREQPRFTIEERDRLVALRTRLRDRPAYPYAEMGLDEARLQFVRWLADHGKISEKM
jgi:hypothetical protein